MNVEILLNQVYNARKISGDTFSVEMKDEKNDVAIKLIISKLNKNSQIIIDFNIKFEFLPAVPDWPVSDCKLT